MDVQTDLITAEARDLLDHAASIANAEPFETAADPDSPHTEPERHAIEYLDEHDITLCGASDSRLFFTLPDTYTRVDEALMVKLARYSDDPATAGTTHNRRERELWESADDTQRELLLPVIDANDTDEWVLTFKPTSADRDSVPEQLTDDLADQNWDSATVEPTDIGHYSDADAPLLVNYGSVVSDTGDE